MIAYLRRVGLETDIWLSVLTGGAMGETISLRVAQAKQRGSRPACWVCAALSQLVERHHCAKQLDGTTTSPAGATWAGFWIALGRLIQRNAAVSNLL